MSRMIPLVILVLGLALAAASGARLGTDHARYRQAVWTEAHAEGAAQEEAAAWIADRGVPGPTERLGQWWSLAGLTWLGGISLIVAGAVLARRQIAADVASGEASGAVDFPGSIDRIEAALQVLSEHLEAVQMDDTAASARAELDALAVDVIDPLVDGRAQLVARHGVAGFAAYFSPFSGGERQLNRVWSALADGHVVVAREALADARRSFREAREAWVAAG